MYVCVFVHVSMADVESTRSLIIGRHSSIMGPISVCLSAGDWDHKETQTRHKRDHYTLSILTPEKLLFFLSQGDDLLAAQLVTARVIDRVWQGLYNENQQQN